MNNGIPPREIKKLQYGAEARQTVLNGVTKLYEAVSSTYGPSANNVLQGMAFGDPVLTRDGVTVAKRTILEDRAENDAASVMRQASEKTNKTAGDGTTSTIVLGYNLLKAANARVVAGDNPMKLKKLLTDDSKKVIEYVKSRSIDATDHLLEVATVSSGDPAIGALVADTMQDIGLSGGITIREQSYPVVDVEKINGYYFDKGYFGLNGQIDWAKPNILVTQKPLVSAADVLPIIKFINGRPSQQLLIIGEVRGDALQIIIANTMAQADQQGRPIPFEGIVLPPPAYGEQAKLYFDDIATYVGGQVYTEADADVLEAHFGSAGRVVVSQEHAILFTGAGIQEDVDKRVAELKVAVDAETEPHHKSALEDRYSKLVGKIAIVNVGAATPTEMEELRFRVEDAIEAVKSAMQDGIVPGAGRLLAESSELDTIDPLFKSALEQTFFKLYENAGENGKYRLQQMLMGKLHEGFNLRDMTDKLIDLRKAGIWDATRAVVQTVENATSAAGALLTVGALVTPYDEAPTKPN